MTRRLRFRDVHWLALCALAFSSCATIDHGPAAPDANSVALDQLVIHSNFQLPRGHRLLKELNLQRATQSMKLELPVSDEPIHVYLFTGADDLRSYAKIHYPDAPERRAFFVETDTRLTVYAYWGDRVAEDLRHEVAHGYLHANLQNLPLWLDEGLAEYFEVPQREQGLNRPHVEHLAALMKKGWAPDIKRLERFRSAGEMTQTDYAEAWAWVHMMLDTDPPRRKLIRDYLQILNRGDLAEPLSYHLERSRLADARALSDHVAELSRSLQ